MDPPISVKLLVSNLFWEEFGPTSQVWWVQKIILWYNTIHNIYPCASENQKLSTLKVETFAGKNFRYFAIFGRLQKFIPAKSYFHKSSRNIAWKIAKNSVKIRKFDQNFPRSRKLIPAKLNFYHRRSWKFIPAKVSTRETCYL